MLFAPFPVFLPHFYPFSRQALFLHDNLPSSLLPPYIPPPQHPTSLFLSLSLFLMNVTSTDGGCRNPHTYSCKRSLTLNGRGKRGGAGEGGEGGVCEGCGKGACHPEAEEESLVCLCPCLRFVLTKTPSVPPAAVLTPLDLSRPEYHRDYPLIIPRCHVRMGGKVGPLWTAQWVTNTLAFLALFRVS